VLRKLDHFYLSSRTAQQNFAIEYPIAIILSMQIFIRQITPGDAAEVAALSHQLGYPSTTEQMFQNIKAVLATNDRDAYVAVLDDKIIGWIGVYYSVQLESPPYCEINGLVIDENFRGKGIGKMLIEKIKQWGKEKGTGKLRLHCNVKRKETHLFYQHLGFQEMKEQKVFELRT